jgi:heme/copper-type cytochrome/quinol oxidase subunit 2
VKKPLSYLRGDLRIASFVFVVLAAVFIPSRPASLVSKDVQAAEVYTVRLSVGASGFEPKRVAVPLGTVHLVVTAREGDHCLSIPSLDVEKRVRSSRPLEVDVSFERTGEFPFHCCAEGAGTSETGVIVVSPAK